MVTVNKRGSYYVQRCCLVDTYVHSKAYPVYGFIVDTGAPQTVCDYSCVDQLLSEQVVSMKCKSAYFGGYIGYSGVKHYLYPVEHFYLGNIDLGRQEVWVTFDGNANANLLGLDLLQQLRFMQCKDTKQLLIFKDDADIKAFSVIVCPGGSFQFLFSDKQEVIANNL